MGRLSELIEAKLGFKVRAEFSPKAVPITTTEKQVLREHADRLSWIMFNLGSEVAYVHNGKAVSSTLGFYLDKNGGFLAMDWETDGEMVGYPWWVEGAGATTLYLAAVVGA